VTTSSLIRLARRAVGVSGVAILVVLLGLAVLTRVAPLTGRDLFVIVGGSMEPSIPTGSLVVVTRTDASTVMVGDVVTIRADNGVVVTHRVNRLVDTRDGRFFELKGDANETADGGLVPARAIVGAADQYIPYAGYVQNIMSTSLGMVAALSFLGAIFLVYLLLEMLEAPRDPKPVRTRGPIGP
jgi:signal peptidase I